MRRASWIAIGAALVSAACGDDETGTSAASGSTSGPGAASSTGAGGTGAAGGMGGGGDGGVGAAGGSGGAAQATRVFVSSALYTGAFGALTGADARCQGLADAANLGGTWMAWLGDGVVGPVDRLAHSTLPYLLVGGGEIAKSWDDLVDGTFEVPIDHDESGTALMPASTMVVRTGAFVAGTPAPLNCMGMKSEDPNEYALTGVASSVDQNWTMSAGIPCSEPDRLYCFEQ